MTKTTASKKSPKKTTKQPATKQVKKTSPSKTLPVTQTDVVIAKNDRRLLKKLVLLLALLLGTGLVIALSDRNMASKLDVKTAMTNEETTNSPATNNPDLSATQSDSSESSPTTGKGSLIVTSSRQPLQKNAFVSPQTMPSPLATQNPEPLRETNPLTPSESQTSNDTTPVPPTEPKPPQPVSSSAGSAQHSVDALLKVTVLQLPIVTDVLFVIAL